MLSYLNLGDIDAQFSCFLDCVFRWVYSVTPSEKSPNLMPEKHPESRPCLDSHFHPFSPWFFSHETFQLCLQCWGLWVVFYCGTWRIVTFPAVCVKVTWGESDKKWGVGFGKWELKRTRNARYHVGVSGNGGTPKTRQKWSFLVGKPMVVGYHHFRKPPCVFIDVFGRKVCWTLDCEGLLIQSNHV